MLLVKSVLFHNIYFWYFWCFVSFDILEEQYSPSNKDTWLLKCKRLFTCNFQQNSQGWTKLVCHSDCNHEVNKAEVIFPALLTQWRTFSRTMQSVLLSVLICCHDHDVVISGFRCSMLTVGSLSQSSFSLSLWLSTIFLLPPHLTTHLLTTNKLTVSSGVSSAVGKYVTVFVTYTSPSLY